MKSNNYHTLGMLLLSGIFVLVAFFPLLVSAEQLVPCDGPDCNACELYELGQNILGFLITIAVMIGVVVFAVAGVKMVTSAGNTSQVEKAKEHFSNALIGILITLGAWLIINTVMNTLANDRALTGGWNSIQCTDVSSSSGGGSSSGGSATRTGGLSAGGSAEGGAEGGNTGSGSASHEANVAQLQDGIRVVSSGTCSDKNNGSCTSLDGMGQETVGRINTMADACNCASSLVITGGTETGHAGGQSANTHGGGDKFDLQLNPTVNAHINGFQAETYRGRAGRGTDGVFCVHEGNHWDCLAR